MSGHGIDYGLRNTNACAYHDGRPADPDNIGVGFCLAPTTSVVIAASGGKRFVCDEHAEHAATCATCSASITRIAPKEEATTR